MGENPLYVDNDWYTVWTSLPSPAGRGSCGLVCFRLGATSDLPATTDAVRWLGRPIRAPTNSKPSRAKPVRARDWPRDRRPWWRHIWCHGWCHSWENRKFRVQKFLLKILVNVVVNQMCLGELHWPCEMSARLRHPSRDCIPVIINIKGVFPQNVKRKFFYFFMFIHISDNIRF